jgi:hypothetical protein
MLITSDDDVRQDAGLPLGILWLEQTDAESEEFWERERLAMVRRDIRLDLELQESWWGRGEQ